MNVEFPEMVHEALRSIPPADVRLFFERMRRAHYDLIRVAGTGGTMPLTSIQDRVKLLDEMEQMFLTARQQPLTTNDNDEG